MKYHETLDYLMNHIEPERLDLSKVDPYATDAVLSVGQIITIIIIGWAVLNLPVSLLA